MSLVKVVIPIYKIDLSQNDKKALSRAFKVLSEYPFVIICPYGLDVSSVCQLADAKNVIEIERFGDECFRGIEGYNRLMLADYFYERFLSVDYILICQTDAYVFRDDLAHWCSRGYDYIGAPWIASKERWFSPLTREIDNVIRLLKGKKRRDWRHLFKVGNGGFSLRRVNSFHCISTSSKSLIEELKNNPDSVFATEDVFWSLKAPELLPGFRIPDYTEAVAFAMDRKPDIAMSINNNRLPFACHGFGKPKVRDFWAKHIG